MQLAQVEGVLERITYANEETGYTVARVDTGRGANDLLTVVGALLGAQVGESLRLFGRWGSHPKFGRQFTVENYTTVLPATVQGIQRYLGSGLIKGIGPRFAERIVERFGAQTLEVIENEPKRLIEVPGLGPKRTKMIAAAWEEQKSIKEVMVFLQGVQVSTSLAVRIYKQYGDGSIGVVKNQPYRLASDVWGIGFLTADRIAQAVGIPHDSPERVKAGLQYALSQSTDDGNCYLPEERLIADGVKLLQVDVGLVIDCLAELVAAEGWCASGCRARTGSRSRRCTWCRSTGRRSRWPVSCCGCCARRRTGCRGSGRWTGRPRWAGWRSGRGRSWPRSRSSRCAWR
ncbi:helix-hairpin-helix domain-containing protein [Kitasatospora saccharophila]|uniref:helix-hairpin-helix domain-containing protein n=1 Tax=Kitasatospora saccharophila TaxID=407973 RepID=UPI003631A088